jgi:hypothetical protein
MIPHLMNCQHTGEGWCLACVKAQYEELNQRLIDRTSVYMDSKAKDVARINALESLLAQMAEAMEHNEREFPTWWSYDTKGKAALAAYRNYREESK